MVFKGEFTTMNIEKSKDVTNIDRTIYLINMRTKEKQIDINIVNNKVKGSIDAITLTYEDYNTFLNAL